MRKKILVSIIVPVYNNEKDLEECVLSLVNQTYKKIEIILVNDGSTDNSDTLMKSLQKKYKNVSTFTQVNQGASRARYKGLQKSTGDYIMFIDADDYLETTAVESLTKILEKKPYDTIRFLGILEPSKKIKNQYDFKGKKKKELTKKEIYNLLIETKLLNSLCFGIYKRSLLDDIESFTSKISNCEDYWANLDIYTKVEKALLLNEVFYHYRENMNSTTRSLTYEKVKKNTKELISVYSRLFSYLERWNKKTKENQKKVAFTILEMIRLSMFTIFQVENISKETRKQFIEEVLNEKVLEEIRTEVTYEELKEYLKKKPFKYRLKNSRNIKNMYKGKKNALYKNYYAIWLRKKIKEG